MEALTKLRWPIMISGPVGTGKTFAMACVYRSWRVTPQKPATILWYDTSDLLSKIIACRTSPTHSITTRFSNGTTSEQFEGNFYAKISRAGLLCLDDMGIKEPTPSKYEILKRILDLRSGKPTLITTNLDHKRFTEVFDERIYSRAFCGPVVWAEGEDRRFEWRREEKRES